MGVGDLSKPPVAYVLVDTVQKKNKDESRQNTLRSSREAAVVYFWFFRIIFGMIGDPTRYSSV